MELHKNTQNMEESPMEKRQREFLRQLPAITEELIEKGRCVLSEKHSKSWEMQVCSSLSQSIYQGEEFRCSLALMEALNGGCTLEEAESLFLSQSHSGGFHSIIKFFTSIFCDRGREFFAYLSKADMERNEAYFITERE